MFDRTKNVLSWLVGIVGLGNFFAEAVLQPNNWLPSNNAKRSRIGSFGKSHPEGFSAKDRRAPRRGRYLRMAPSWSNPDRLMARANGERHDGRFMLPARGGNSESVGTKARPHRRKSDNQIRFARTKGNNGPTINKRLRAKFHAGKGGGRQAAVLGVML